MFEWQTNKTKPKEDELVLLYISPDIIELGAWNGIYFTNAKGKKKHELDEIEKWSIIPNPMTKKKEKCWSFVGDNLFRCPQCDELYSVQQFQDIKNHITDPDFPNYCPHCGSHNYRGENEN